MPATRENAPFRAACLTTYTLEPLTLHEKLTYIAWGEETCPTTGRAHLQAFAYAQVAMRLSGWKKVFPGAHIEPMLGNFRQNERYCSKEGKYHELGEKPMENGKKRVLDAIKDELEKGRPLKQVARSNEHFQAVMQYRTGLQWYEHNLRYDARIAAGYRKPEVTIIIGLTEVGKTRQVYDTHGFENVYKWPPGNSLRWAGTYDNQEVVLFDEMMTNQMTVSQFLQITDGYPMELEKKGGYVMFNAKYIYFTSNVPMRDWFSCSDEHYAACLRRVTHQVFKGDHPMPE